MADKNGSSLDVRTQTAEDYIRLRWEEFPDEVKKLSRYTEFAMGIEIGLRFEYWRERNNVLEEYIQKIGQQNKVFCLLLEELIPDEEELDRRLKKKEEDLRKSDADV